MLTTDLGHELENGLKTTKVIFLAFILCPYRRGAFGDSLLPVVLARWLQLPFWNSARGTVLSPCFRQCSGMNDSDRPALEARVPQGESVSQGQTVTLQSPRPSCLEVRLRSWGERELT